MPTVRTIDLSADTNNTGTNVVNLSNVDGARTGTTALPYAVTGSAGVDQITMSAAAGPLQLT